MKFPAHMLSVCILLVEESASFIDNVGILQLNNFIIHSNKFPRINIHATKHFHILTKQSKEAFFLNFHDVLKNLHDPNLFG